MNKNFTPHKNRLLCDEMNRDPSMNLEYRGPVTMKGKPEPMDCWILTRKLIQKNKEVEQTSTVKSIQQQSSTL